MALEAWLTFCLTATVILIVPGPTIVYVVGQSLFHGKKTVFPLAAGVVLGDATCLVLSVLGLSALLAISSTAFMVIKLVGAAYLIYLGVSMIKSGLGNLSLDAAAEIYSAKQLFHNVFVITALNPKGIIFYSAFMPQFVDPSANVAAQFILLGASFLLLALLNTVAYALLSGHSADVFRSPSLARWFSTPGGVALIGAGVVAATLDRD